MHLVFETSYLYILRAGVARYIRCLQKEFAGENHSDLRISELAWPVENFSYHQPERMLRTLYRESIWACGIAPAKLRALAPEVFFSPGFSFVRGKKPCPYVMTLYDCHYLKTPWRFRRWTRFRAKAQLAQVHEADKVICISQTTADDAMELLGVPARKLEVTPLGCAFSSQDAGDARALPEGFNPPGDYFLAVGSLEPGKNLALLRRVYETWPKGFPPLPPLILVGERFAGMSTEGPAPANWIYAGRLPDAALIWLYRHARALLFPSLYEGFGLPLVEAMTLNCPIITSNAGSLPEVAGDAGLICPPTVEAFRDAMKRILTEPALARDLRRQGAARAPLFSWSRCADETLRILQDVVKS